MITLGLRHGTNPMENATVDRWSWTEAVFFASTVITTVGTYI